MTDLDNLGYQKKLMLLEEEMLKMEQAECPLRHIYGPGIYIREVTLPADTWAIGHHQNFEHMNVMIAGKVRMYNEDGTTTVIEAPQTFVGKPGRKVGYVIEKTIWQNVYATNETDVEKLEAYYLTKSPVSIDFQNKRFLSLKDKHQEDRDDYAEVLKKLNVTEEQVQEQVQNLDDRIDLPPAAYCFELSDSPIHGKGMFATSPILAGTIIGPGRLHGKRTVLGRYINHSKNPNAAVFSDGYDIWVKAISDIGGKRAGTNGDEITIDYLTTHALNKSLENVK